MKTIHHQLDHLLEAFDAVDDTGTLIFTMPSDEIDPDEVRGRLNIAREMISGLFYNQHLATVRLGLVKSFVKEVLIDLDRDSNGDWRVEINFAKLMLLPCQNPAAELRELRRLFDTFRSSMLNNPARLAIIAITNERDSQGRVYGTARLTYREKTADSQELINQEQHVIDQLMTNSPLIQEYLRQVALALGKMGRYSWVTLTEDQLFSYGQGPWISTSSPYQPSDFVL